MNFALAVAIALRPFLTEYQTDKPMIFFFLFGEVLGDASQKAVGKVREVLYFGYNRDKQPPEAQQGRCEQALSTRKGRRRPCM